MSLLRVVGAVVQRGEQVLLAQRAPGGAHGGLWEFPGGKVEVGESDRSALARELREELGVDAAVGELVGVGEDNTVALWCYRCTLLGTPQALEHNALQWFPIAEVDLESMPPADHPALRALQAGRLSNVADST